MANNNSSTESEKKSKWQIFVQFLTETGITSLVLLGKCIQYFGVRNIAAFVIGIITLYAYSYWTKSLPGIGCQILPWKNEYYLQMYDVDDHAKAYVNGKEVAVASFDTDIKCLPIENYLKSGENIVTFELENNALGWTYNFEIWKGNKIIYKRACGDKGEYGCKNDDHTRGKVFTDTAILFK